MRSYHCQEIFGYLYISMAVLDLLVPKFQQKIISS